MSRRKISKVPLVVLALFAIAASSTALAGQTCSVPGDRASVAEAVGDPACSQIDLAGLDFEEGSVVIARDLTLSGTSSGRTTLTGQLKVVGSTTQATIRNLTIDAAAPSIAGCFGPALDVAGAQVSTLDVIARNGSGLGPLCTLFADGFESGGISNWSGSQP